MIENAIYCMKESAGITSCEECENYMKCDYELQKHYSEMAIEALEERQKYKALENRLKKVYGDCDGLLETVVSGLEKHERAEFEKPIKVRLLTDDDVDRWEAYKAIGTVEECREAREKQIPVKPKVGAECMIGSDNDGNPIWDTDYACAECGMGIAGEYVCCPYCGKQIDWS